MTGNFGKSATANNQQKQTGIQKQSKILSTGISASNNRYRHSKNENDEIAHGRGHGMRRGSLHWMCFEHD
jgi:hypothetical protein